MRNLPKRKGISFGTITMLTLTGLVVLGCAWIFPRLLGEASFQFDAQELAVTFDRSYTELTYAFNPQASSPPMETPPPPLEQGEPQFPSATVPTKASFRLTATGSVRVDSTVQKAMTDDTGYHFTDLFSLVSGDLTADLSIFTLENTVIPSEKINDTNIPADVLTALQSSGFKAVCLGYPGALSGGLSGVSATQDAVRAAGMTPYGVYASQEQRNTPTLLEINGISVALLNYQSELNSASKRAASKEEQALAIVPPDLETITADIQALRAAGAQVVVVSLCWGKDGATSPTKAQRESAQAIADAGADIILGTRSGVVQTVELLDTTRENGEPSQTLCAYSLGNFFSGNRNKRSSISGILLHANITYDLATHTTAFDELSYTPTYVWRGKKTDKTVHAVLPSDETPPDYVQGDQLGVMERSLELIQGVMEDTPIVRREPGSVFEQTADAH